MSVILLSIANGALITGAREDVKTYLHCMDKEETFRYYLLKVMGASRSLTSSSCGGPVAFGPIARLAAFGFFGFLCYRHIQGLHQISCIDSKDLDEPKIVLDFLGHGRLDSLFFSANQYLFQIIGSRTMQYGAETRSSPMTVTAAPSQPPRPPAPVQWPRPRMWASFTTLSLAPPFMSGGTVRSGGQGAGN
jgi:hypothetical protein